MRCTTRRTSPDGYSAVVLPQSSCPPWRLTKEYGGRALRPPPMSSACPFHISLSFSLHRTLPFSFPTWVVRGWRVNGSDRGIRIYSKAHRMAMGSAAHGTACSRVHMLTDEARRHGQHAHTREHTTAGSTVRVTMPEAHSRPKAEGNRAHATEHTIARRMHAASTAVDGIERARCFQTPAAAHTWSCQEALLGDGAHRA